MASPQPSEEHFQKFCPRIFPNEISPFLYGLAPAACHDLLSLSTTSFLSQHQLPSTCWSLHNATSPIFLDTNLPFSSPLLSLPSLLSLILSCFLFLFQPNFSFSPLSSFPLSFPPFPLSFTNIYGALASGLGYCVGGYKGSRILVLMGCLL